MYSAKEYLFHQPIDRCFVDVIAVASNNRSMSGGLPHSEIPGSKGALASPGLIAECHVLHRLLPPRHPPNALLALDPIQKTEDPPPGKTARHRPALSGGWTTCATISVSVA